MPQLPLAIEAEERRDFAAVASTPRIAAVSSVCDVLELPEIAKC